jgi:hypothetical protein
VAGHPVKHPSRSKLKTVVRAQVVPNPLARNPRFLSSRSFSYVKASKKVS